MTDEWERNSEHGRWLRDYNARRAAEPVVRHKPVETKVQPVLAQSIAAHLKRGRKRRAAA